VAAITFVTVLVGGTQDWSLHWLSRRPFVSALPLRCDGRFRSGSRYSADAGARPVRSPPPASSGCATSLRSLLALEGTMLGLFLVARPASLRRSFWDLMLVPVFFGLGRLGEHPADRVAVISSITLPAAVLTLLLATAAFGVIYVNDRRDRSSRQRARRRLGSLDFCRLRLRVSGGRRRSWPLHTWMPPTYAGLPSTMTSVVSGVQSKAGLYGFSCNRHGR